MRLVVRKTAEGEWGVILEEQSSKIDAASVSLMRDVEKMRERVLRGLKILQIQNAELPSMLRGFLMEEGDRSTGSYVSSVLTSSEMLFLMRSLASELLNQVEFNTKIDLALLSIEQISLSEEQCRRILLSDKQIIFEEAEYCAAFPFMARLEIQAEKKANSKVHTLEVCDAFMRLSNGDFDGYNRMRGETYKAVHKKTLTVTIPFAQDGDALTELGKILNALRGRVQGHISYNPLVWKMALFLLPLIHDIGKTVQLAAHPEIGADHFVALVLEIVWRQAGTFFKDFNQRSLEMMMPFVQQIVRSHVDIATIATAERSPSTLRDVAKTFRENDLFFMDLLTLLSLSDRSYGDRANALTGDKFLRYLNLGSLQSEVWRSMTKQDWCEERIGKFLPSRRWVSAESEPTLRFCLGENIHVIDYGNVLFKDFNEREPSGKSLVVLFLTLGLVIQSFDPDKNTIRRITLTKKKEQISALYKKIVTEEGEEPPRPSVQLFPFFRKFGEEVRLMTDELGDDRQHEETYRAGRAEARTISDVSAASLVDVPSDDASGAAAAADPREEEHQVLLGEKGMTAGFFSPHQYLDPAAEHDLRHQKAKGVLPE